MLLDLNSYLDDVGALTEVHQRDLYALEPAAVEAFRLTALKRRFSELHERVGALKKLAGIQGVSKIESLDDVVPILFQHTVYKSYPMSFLEQGKFANLTKWLGQLTTRDLSGVKAENCHFVDDWFRLIELHTDITPIHTTGTSGKLSVIPRTARETKLQLNVTASLWQGVGDERDMPLDLKNPTQRLPIIHPGYRHGFYTALRLLDQRVQAYSSEDLTLCMYDDWLSPDVLSLAGRVMSAEAKGELDKLQVAPELLERFRTNQDRTRNRHKSEEALFERALEAFGGERVVITSPTPLYFAWAQEGMRRGLKGIFAPDSYLATGGGFKGASLPADWQQQIEEVIGGKLMQSYAMSELASIMTGCSHGNYHIAPFTIPFVLDEVSGEALPRRGEQTGRAAFFDLLPESYWAGFVTGDEITINWDSGCGCGRKGAYVLPTIRRFSEKNGGDDKISCAGAPDAQEKAMEYLNKVASAV